MELTVDKLVEEWLAEDVGDGDVTTERVISVDATCEAALLLKEPGVVAGIDVAEQIFRALDSEVRFERHAYDGERFEAPARLATLSGPVRPILTGERTALNLLGRLSGIATLTRRFADAVEGTGAGILDTRKTTPGLRVLEKHAVRCGGGQNHRFGLYDGILIKDNHLAVAGSIAEAVTRAAGTDVPVQVEVETLDGLREALDAGADSVLLDNMSNELMRKAVAIARGRASLEASGGVTVDTIRAIAETGVDFISIGALTHSARSLDVSMEVLL
jgi:nicotinate-nucleotide pyrophosphorylase (carboxylating)